MTVIDIILLVVLLIGLIKGFINGLFVELASITALAAGIYGAIHFSNYAANFLKDNLDWNIKTINIAAFIITFIIIVLVVSLAGKALTKLASFAALGILNKILGGIFGVLKMGLILSVILVVLERLNQTIPFLDEKTSTQSILYQPVKELVPIIFPIILENVKTQEEPFKNPQKV